MEKVGWKGDEVKETTKVRGVWKTNEGVGISGGNANRQAGAMAEE